MKSNTDELQYGDANIKCGPDNQMDEADAKNTIEELYNIIKKENSEEPSQLTVSISIKRESDDDMEGILIADHQNIQDNSVEENLLELLNTEFNIKCESDNQMEEADKDVQQSEHTIEELNNVTQETDIKEENSDLSTSCDKLAVVEQLTYDRKDDQYNYNITEKLYYCALCQYKTTKKPILINHMRTHTGQKPFSCNICPYKTAENANLARHMRIHTGEKPYSCTVCQYKTAIKDNLTTHMRSHTGEKPFSCVICQYKSVGKNGLARHMRTHTKPYSCDACEYKAARKERLINHKRIHTGEKFIKPKSQKKRM